MCYQRVLKAPKNTQKLLKLDTQSLESFKMILGSYGTGWTAILATPPKKQSPRHGGGDKKNRVQELPPCLGLCFFWGGGKNSDPPCSSSENTQNALERLHNTREIWQQLCSVCMS